MPRIVSFLWIALILVFVVKIFKNSTFGMICDFNNYLQVNVEHFKNIDERYAGVYKCVVIHYASQRQWVTNIAQVESKLYISRYEYPLKVSMVVERMAV